jgi:hypothetical protein
MEQTAWPRVRTGATLVARLVLGTVFGLAALAKIAAPGLFPACVHVATGVR